MEETGVAWKVIVTIGCSFIVLLYDSIDLIRRVHLCFLPLSFIPFNNLFALVLADLALHYLRQSRQNCHAFFYAHHALDELLLHLDHSLPHLLHLLRVQQDRLLYHCEGLGVNDSFGVLYFRDDGSGSSLRLAVSPTVLLVGLRLYFRVLGRQ